MSNQFTNYHGKSVAAKDVASYGNYIDRYDDLGTAADNWMNDDSNIHFANYVRDNDEVWDKWVKSGKKDKKDMWDFGHRDWNTGGGKTKDRHLAKVLTNPGDLNKTGSEFDDMGVVSAFKSARWGYDQDAQDKLRAGYGKFNWGTYGYNEGREMKWLDAKDTSNIYATTKGVASGNKKAKDIYALTPQQRKEIEVAGSKQTEAAEKSKEDRNSFFNSYKDTYPFGGLSDKGPKSTPGVFHDSYQWVNNNSGEIWKPDPDRKWGDPQPGKKPSPTDGPFIDWAEDPRLQEWTKTPYSPKRPNRNERYQWVNNNSGDIWKPDPSRKVDFEPGLKPAPNDLAMEWADDPRLQEWTKTPYSPKRPDGIKPHIRDYPRLSPGGMPAWQPKETPSGFGSKPIGSSADDPLTGDTYVGRGWANYWQQSIPDRDPNWSERFVNQSVKFGDQNQVIDRKKLVQRIQARTQNHYDQSDYLGYLSRGQMRGENRPNWNQPSPIKSDYQPDINVSPFLDRMYDIGRKDNK